MFANRHVTAEAAKPKINTNVPDPFLSCMVGSRKTTLSLSLCVGVGGGGGRLTSLKLVYIACIASKSTYMYCCPLLSLFIIYYMYDCT